MPAERVAREHYRTQQALAASTARVAADAWQRVDPDRIVASWREASPRVTLAITAAQRAAAGQADSYLDSVLAEQGIGTDADGEVDPSAFSGIASDGRELQTLVRQPANLSVAAIRRGERVPRALAAGQASLDMIARTQVADAGRTADQVSLVAHRSASGYVRLLVPPSCSRCAILAGRWYRYNAGFQRHPRCDCRHIPSTENIGGDLRANPRAYFDSLSREEQDRIFTQAGAQAIRDGADMGQVVNARRGMHTADGRRLTRESVTRRGIARPGRLMPEQIYRVVGSREEALDLLRRHGYLRTVAPVPRPVAVTAAPAATEVPLTPSQRAAREVVGSSADPLRQEIVSELDRQVGLTPLASRDLRAVEVDDPLFESGEAYASANAIYRYDSRSIHLHPAWIRSPEFQRGLKQRALDRGWSTPTGAPTTLRSTLAHEYGHHVHHTMRDLGWQSQRQLASTIRDQLGIQIDVDRIGSFDSMSAQIDAGVLRAQDRVAEMVSGYGATSGNELLAEIWQEYSTAGSAARPHIREIGRQMQELAELAVQEAA